MAEDVGSLIVRVSANVDNLEKGMKSAGDKVGDFVGKAAKIGAIIGAGMAAAGAAVFGMASKAAEATDRIDKLSQKIGISRQGFQEWDFMLSQSGASVEGLQGGMKALTGRVQEVIDGTGQGAAMFEQLSVKVNDSSGAVKNQEQLLNEVVIAFQGMEDGSLKAALANDLLGRSGSELMPLLNGAAGSAEELRKKANDLGLVLSDTAVDSGVKFTDTMDQVKRSLGAAATSIGVQLMPMVQKMADWVIEHMPQIKEVMKNVFEYIENVVKNSSKAFDYLNENVLPVAKKGFDGLGKIVKFVSDHFDIFIPILAGITAGFLAYNAIMLISAAITKGLALKQAILNGVMAANPIGLVVLAIGALVTAGILLYKNWDTVKVYMLKIFDSISYGVQTAISFMKTTVLKGLDVLLGSIESFMGFIPGLGDIIKSARKNISSMIDAEKVKQDAKAFSYAANQISYDIELQEISIKKLEAANEDTTEATSKLIETKKEEVVAIKKSTEANKEAAEAAKKLREETVKNLDTLGDAVKKALTKRYESEESLQLTSLTKQSDALKRLTESNINQYDREYAAKLKLFDAETSEELKALQAQIDAIDEQTDAEEKGIKEREYQEKLAIKQKELTAAQTDEEKLKLTDELNDMLAKKERENILESRKQQKESIKNEMELVRTRADEKREAMRIELEEKKKHEQQLSEEKQKGISAEMKSIEDHYKTLKSEEALQNEARKLVIANNNEEIVKLLGEYNPKWQDAGQSFGESLLDGLNSTKSSIKQAVNSILTLVNKGSQDVLSGNGFTTYIVKAGDTLSAIAQKFETSIKKIAEASNISDINLIRTGQKLQIPKLAKGTNFVPFDTMAFLHKGEAVIPAANNPGNTSANNPVGQNINFENMVTGNTFIVRSDNDISMIAREFYNLTTGRNRGSGVVPAT